MVGVHQPKKLGLRKQHPNVVNLGDIVTLTIDPLYNTNCMVLVMTLNPPHITLVNTNWCLLNCSSLSWSRVTPVTKSWLSWILSPHPQFLTLSLRNTVRWRILSSDELITSEDRIWCPLYTIEWLQLYTLRGLICPLSDITVIWVLCYYVNRGVVRKFNFSNLQRHERARKIFRV